MSHQDDINDLRRKIAGYKPGATIQFANHRLANPPSHLRVGLFGPTGVGKSAFINSANYAVGELWDHIAPEGFAHQFSMTTARHAYDIAEHITLIDNRGMKDLGTSYMPEVRRQFAGVYRDETEVEWNKDFAQKLATFFAKAKTEFEIHCAVFVVSLLNLSMNAQDLREVIQTIGNMTGEPPIIVLTHRRHPDVRQNDVAVFRTGLRDQGIEHVFELENYTSKDHLYDAEKHLTLVKAIYQCAIVGDRVMQRKEKKPEGSWCTIS